MLKSMLAQQEYKERFLLKSGQHFVHVPISAIAYFFSEDGMAFAQCTDGKKHIIGYTLDQLEGHRETGSGSPDFHLVQQPIEA